MPKIAEKPRAHPRWLKKNIILSGRILETKAVLKELRLNTVCESSLCPNLNECFSRRFATFMILGRSCTRRCGFCSIGGANHPKDDRDSAEDLLEAVRRLSLSYVIITSVTRDDLADGGSSRFADIIRALKSASNAVRVEVLVPDFMGREEAVRNVVSAGPDLFGHNIETVERLYPLARPQGIYSRSLDVLRKARAVSGRILIKSGLMVGMGETEDEVIGTMKDLRSAGCDMVTIGQYLRPDSASIEVRRFVTPEEFACYQDIGKELGFKNIWAGPFVRSSYLADKIYKDTGGDCND